MKRTALARRTRLAPMSAKRRAESVERKELCERVRNRDRHRCQAFGKAPGHCGGGTDVHEIIPRSAWSRGYLVDSNCIVVCRVHHDWIGLHPGHAHDLGLHGYSWMKPAGER